MKKIKWGVIVNGLIKLACVIGVIVLGLAMIKNSNMFGESTGALLLGMVIGALGVSLGYTAKNDSKQIANL